MNSLVKQLIVLAASAASLFAENILENPCFDQGPSRWILFIPDTSKDHGNTFTVSPTAGEGGGPAAMLSSPVMSRCGIAQKNIPIQGWTRYRVTYWFKADKDVQYKVGPMLRLNFRASDHEGDTDYYVGLGGKLYLDSKEFKRPNWLPETWEKVEAIVESPINAKHLSLCFFSWSVKGTVYFDNLSIEPLPKETK